MNIYLESVNLDEIRNAALAGLADGRAFPHVAVSADAPDAGARERPEELTTAVAMTVSGPGASGRAQWPGGLPVRALAAAPGDA